MIRKLYCHYNVKAMEILRFKFIHFKNNITCFDLELRFGIKSNIYKNILLILFIENSASKRSKVKTSAQNRRRVKKNLP